MRRLLSPSERADYGVIATLDDGSVIVRKGTPTDALLAVADYCDVHGFKIRTLSSPETIYRDLQGTRDGLSDTERGGPLNPHNTHRSQLLALPEFNMVARIGRSDLLEA